MSNTFRERLARHETLTGTWIKTPSPIVCEVLGGTPLDAVCLDAEHAPFDRGDLDRCVHALRAAGMPSLVRVQSAAPDQILNALDVGATGVIVPHVSSPAMAKSVARVAHYGPGGRGYAGSSRAAGYGARKMPEHLRVSAAETTVIAQIEDAEALETIDQIAAVDGIDCLFVGRIDLTVSLGCQSPADPPVVEAVERICAACVAAKRPVGMFVGDVAEVATWHTRGATVFLLSSDHAMLIDGARRLADDVAGQV